MVLCLAGILLLLQCLCGVVGEVVACSGMVPMVYMNDKIFITNFRPFGDATTLNTKAFWKAIYTIEQLNRRAGTLFSQNLENRM
ncbi:pectin lyase-like superfamily protein [Artemisia annua]|uniref:Pectin lyase-like superfamily protein n=1 Tax=Artemisia annua TaxID=35608 RepID=A0A2U1LYR5_ARTAN|nr:pectin lyase-like superfamily protein [Artemisia annua]